MPIARPLKLRLFLEGQEVPVIAASINIGLNAASTASIQIIPIDEGMEFKPRTMVHLFFLDRVPNSDEIIEAKKQGITEEEYKRGFYKLLFTGEIVGFAFTQSPVSRGLVIQCLDFSSYWEACHATAIEYGPGGNAFFNQSSVYGANASLFDDIVNFQAERLVGWLQSKPQTLGLTNVSGLAGGIIRMLEAIGGVPDHHKGVNDFFTFAELRCKLLEQITAEETDKTASNLLNVSVFNEWLKNGLQNIGQQVTFRDMVKLLCNYIYYDFVPNPAAKFEPSVKGSSKTTAVTSELNKSPVALKVLSSLEDTRNRLIETTEYTTVQIVKDSITIAVKDLKSQITALKTLGSIASQAVNTLTSTVNNLNTRILNNKTLVPPAGSVAGSTETEVSSAVVSDAASAGASAANISSVSGAAASAISGPAGITKRALTTAITDIESVTALIQGTSTKITVSSTTATSAKTARLRSHIFRPDCFFAAPPRCNVIFPEHFSQVAFDRSFLSEVTRSLTMVHDVLIGQDALLDEKIMAPNIGLDMAKIQKQTGDSGYRLLMPHERHTGIIPRSEQLTNTATINAPTGSTKDKVRGARLIWTQKVALFHFFKYRFAPRQLNVSGRFNPYIVCGFPALVILRPFLPDATKLRQALQLQPSDTIDNSDKKVLELIQTNGTDAAPLGAPFQLLGMVGNVTHTLDQNGGITNVSMNHSRRHLGIDDEFVGIFSERLTTAQKRIRIPIVADKVFASVDKDFEAIVKVLVGVTPQGSKTKTASKVTNNNKQKQVAFSSVSVDRQSGKLVETLQSQSVNQNSQNTQTVSSGPFNTKGRIDGVDGDVTIPNPPGTLTVGSKAPFNAKGTIVGIEVVDSTLITVPVGSNKGKQVFRSIVIHEDVDVPVDEQVPVEEIIRPTWFSSSYQNAKIGEEIYTPFFGTTSIIDHLKFTGLAADAIVTPDDPTGPTYDPKTKFEDIVKELQNQQSNKARLSIERAVNIVSYFYGMVKTEGKDIDHFVRDYTDRPIATMVDIFGSSDLNITYDAQGKATINKGKIGFHSLALDPVAILLGNLAGLVDDKDTKLPRINNWGASEPISPVYDIRKEKLDRIDDYVLALKKGPGLRG